MRTTTTDLSFGAECRSLGYTAWTGREGEDGRHSRTSFDHTDDADWSQAS